MIATIDLILSTTLNTLNIGFTDYDFDAMESTIDFKAEWCDPINCPRDDLDITQFRLLKDMSVSRLDSSLVILFDKNNIDILKNYITKLKEYYDIFPHRIEVDGLYNYIEDYVLGVSINDNIIENINFKLILNFSYDKSILGISLKFIDKSI